LAYTIQLHNLELLCDDQIKTTKQKLTVFNNIISTFFLGGGGIWSWLAISFILSLVMKLDFISQPSSKSALLFAGLQHMQQCQVNFQPISAPGF
jgi:hypothetical protein